MPSLSERIGWVVLAAMLTSSPAALYLTSGIDAPLWYLALSSVARSLGVGLFAVFAGLVVLIAARDKTHGGMRLALIVAAVIGALSSFSIISTA